MKEYAIFEDENARSPYANTQTFVKSEAEERLDLQREAGFPEAEMRERNVRYGPWMEVSTFYPYEDLDALEHEILSMACAAEALFSNQLQGIILRQIAERIGEIRNAI